MDQLARNIIESVLEDDQTTEKCPNCNAIQQTESFSNSFSSLFKTITCYHCKYEWIPKDKAKCLQQT